MTFFVDVFNGDADGLCSLHQLRLAEPVPEGAERLVTGLKREIALLGTVAADLAADPAGAVRTVVTVLDVSLDRNRAALAQILACGATVHYFDHHFAGEVPVHPRLRAVLDPAPDVCTGMLVDRHLGGRFRLWAVVAAYGDNLVSAAQGLAAASTLAPQRLSALRELGQALNYNGYGDSEADVVITARDLYPQLHRFADPFEFHATPLAQRLIARRQEDLAAAMALVPVHEDARCAIYRLPAVPWSRRVVGTFANELASRDRARAFAVLKENGDGTCAVSVRAPRAAPRGADTLCLRFAGGGGRAAAAGVDRLGGSALEEFVAAFRQATWGAVR